MEGIRRKRFYMIKIFKVISFTIFILGLILSTGCTKKLFDDSKIFYSYKTSNFKYYTIQSKEEYGGFWKESILDEDEPKIKLSDHWVIRIKADENEKHLVFNDKGSNNIYRLNTLTDEISLIPIAKGRPIQIYKEWIYYDDESGYLKRVKLEGENDQIIVELIFGKTTKNMEQEIGVIRFEDFDGKSYEIYLDDLD